MNVSEGVTYEDSDSYSVLRNYINPGVYAVIITFGLLVNGLLIWIFLRHKEVRTTASVMIMNLAVCDVMNLSITAPILCIFHFPHDSPNNIPACRFHLAVRQIICNLSAFSLVALCIQRFFITVPSINSLQKQMSQRTLNILYIASIWVLSLALAMPLFMIEPVYDFLCGSYNDRIPTCFVVTLYFTMFSVVLPSVMVTFSVITARRLRMSVLDIPCQLGRKTQEQVRNRSAKVVMSLGILFVLSHLPMWTWSLVSFWTNSVATSASVIISEYVTKYFLFLDSCFNPVALYFASGTFRKFFRKYLCFPGSEVEDFHSCNTSRTSIPRRLSTSSV